ncbi:MULTISPECIES: ribosome maturation factor RimM [Modicisalibacter]|uniref:ribosome maturation factor RimM n=1 Tax=Modicisalibacter TaxID=574347 RepID=UPI00100B4DC7|nr:MULTISPECIES: ribosome maturation factor RimM [Halomonadaceae]MBZ9558210.1 ribosome maturation factor RimM [Modicisalibacter sp. R2A 31.J]MBZ9573122.1 ribosome maturation factor RimM [Modicisalibacter sp. MOD 31.J]
MPSDVTRQGDTDDYVVLGKLTSPHGVRGWLKVYSYTDPMEGILDYPEWVLVQHGSQRVYRVAEGRRQGKGLVAGLEGVTSREQAEQLAGAEILLAKAHLPPLESGDFYWHQLEGLRVVTLEGVDLGYVDYLFETGANDVLVVRGDAESLDEKERLLPFLPDEVIREADLDAGRLTVDWDPEF